MKKILKYIKQRWWYLLILVIITYFAANIWIDIFLPNIVVIKVNNELSNPLHSVTIVLVKIKQIEEIKILEGATTNL
jgi:hypothetical protein